MKNGIGAYCLAAVFVLFCAMSLTAQTLTRMPYLQAGKQDSITIRWRTNVATDSKVTWGTSFVATPGTYANSYTQDVGTPVTEHIVRIGGLSPDTKYWYSVGTSSTVLQQTSTNYFLTLPPDNTTRKLRFLALGDCGNNSTNQVNVRNTFINYIGANDIDAMILIGDNAYNSGTDNEYQTNFFNIYQNDFLRHYKLYPAPGNHDYGNSTSNNTKTGSTPANSMPYHLNFTVPSAGELGGYPSYVKNYYSFNIGDVHFISLDSYGNDAGLLGDTLGTQANWLKNDLAANTKKWTVAYFHHPPYTKTSHTSDTEMDLVAIREKLVRILERNGVDLIICGHSHGYERSYLLKGFYNTYASPLLDANFNAVTHTATGNIQNAMYDGSANSCAFAYNSGKYNHGSVYIVSGSAGQVGGTTAGYPQNCMHYSNPTNGGCFYFEVDSNRLDAKFISYATAPTPLVRDQFTIFKDVKRKQTYNVVTNDPLTLTASWRGSYYWPNNGGATTQSVTLNNNTNGTFTYYARDLSSNNCIEDTFVVTVSGTLSVSLTAFNAVINKDQVELDWTTTREINNRYFTLERSADGTHFSFLGRVNGSGSSTAPVTYRFTDPNPVSGTNFYRLSQTSHAGITTYQDIRRVNFQLNRKLSTSIMNNGNGQATMMIQSDKSARVQIRVMNTQGQQVWERSLALNNGSAVQQLTLRAGAYVVLVYNEAGERTSTKMIIR